MKIHEYQAKAILARYGVTTPRGEVAFTKEEAREAAQRLKAPVVVVKAQIHAGGRGKAGGVKLARSADEAAELASHILGMTLVTPQTGPQGRVVRRLLIEEGLDIKRELYLGLLIDRETGRPVFMASAAGGMEIEEVAKDNPNAILREHIHPAVGLQPYQARKIAFGLGLSGELATVATPFLQALYRAFIDTDASTLDIIKYAGGSPANFLDVGGGASAEQVKNAFRILLSDPEVRAVFINIFGGILRCDVLATGVVAATKDLHVSIPVVVRMEGTNVELGQQILRDSGLNFTIANGMKDGAQKVVALAGGAR